MTTPTTTYLEAPAGSVYVSLDQTRPNPFDTGRLRWKASYAWRVSTDKLAGSSRVVFAEIDGRLVGVWHLREWDVLTARVGPEGRGGYHPVVFLLEDAPEYAHLIGTPSPVHRKRGDQRGLVIQ